MTAVANEGYMFDHWTQDGEVVSYLSTYSFTVTESVEVVAVFMPLSGTLVGGAEGTNEYLPSYSFYKYTLSQQIYTPEEIGGADVISSISYFNTGGTKTRNYDIYMVHTDKTAFESNTDWIAVTEANLVYSGEVTMVQGCWNTIVLDTPFAYDGTSNLAIVVDDNSGNWTSRPHMSCRVYDTQDAQAICIYTDNNDYYPEYPGGYGTVGLYSEKDQMILNRKNVVNAEPNDSAMGSVSGTGEYLSGITCTLSATANPGCYFLNWTEDGNVVSSDEEYSFVVMDDRNLVANFFTNHWIPSESFQNSMFMIGVVQIDGVEQASSALELGAFCNGECRGSEFPVYDEGQWLYFMTIGGNVGDEITFRLYDHALQQELNLYCYNEIPFEIYGLIGVENPYEVQFVSILTISANVSPENAGTITGAGDYLLGTNVMLTAIANEGYAFNSWTLDGEIVSTEPSYTFTVTSEMNFIANFDALYSVSATVNLEDAGTIIGIGIYVSGTEATLIATPYEGYVFKNWTLDGEVVSTEPTYTFTVTEPVNLIANFKVVYTQQLAGTWNWWSANLDITLDDLKAALVAATPNSAITIKNATQNTQYFRGRWNGTLDWDVTRMYLIHVTTDCEITLEGMPLDPAEHPITISNGITWIWFPFSENMSVIDALADFPAVNGDIIKSSTNNCLFNRNRWMGALSTFEPGIGYKFISNSSEDRTLVFPTGAK